MRILVSYRGIPQSPGWATGDMVVKAFRDLGHEVFPYAKYYQQNRWVENKPFGLDDHRWDLVLFMECNDGDPQYPELRITKAHKTACWLFDTSYHQDRYIGLVNYFGFNHIFLANPLTIQEYKVWGYKNVHYLPYACDRELHGRPLSYPKTRDVVLVGSMRDDRRILANACSKLGLDLQLISGVFREEYIDALASARIVVNQNPPEGRGLLNMRHFEAQAAGCMVFEQWQDLCSNQELDVGGLVINYTDASDLPDLYHSYADMNIDLIQGLQQDFFTKHTYTHRCQTILEEVFK